MSGMNRTVCAVAVGALAACGGGGDAADEVAVSPGGAGSGQATALETARGSGPLLATWFDCLRENDAITIAAHRGGPVPGYPENAIETMEYNLDQGLDLFEVDVAESQDGVLFLMHDRSLGRTTTGDGQLVEKDWAEIRGLNLVDNDGVVTEYSPPRLGDALLWAKEMNAVLELDRKSSTSFRNIIAAVRAAEAEDHVVLISYSTDQAALIAELAPDLVMTATANSREDLDALDRAGVNLDNLIAWTGTRTPKPSTWAELRAAGVEPAFGTLGRPGERLDDIYAADGDLSEFAELADGGLVLLSSDISLDVAATLTADDIGRTACPR